MVLAGDRSRHGQAAQGYFMVGENPYNRNDSLGWGDVILWGHVGNFEDKGFLGIDFQLGGEQHIGRARNLEEVTKVLATLRNQGFPGARDVRLIRPPCIQESELGLYLRNEMGVSTIDDYCNLDATTNKLAFTQYALETKKQGDDAPTGLPQ